MSQPDTTKRTVAADAGHMENTVPAGKPYATAKYDTCEHMERQSGLFLLHLFSWPHFHLFMHTFFLVVLYSICWCLYSFVPV